MATSNTASAPKIVWGVDPFEKSSRPAHAALRAIRGVIDPDGKASIYPTYIWGSTMPEVALDLHQMNRQSLQNFAQSRLQELTRGSKFPGLQPLHVTTQPSSGIRVSALRLIRYAKENRADLIVVATHANHGPKRWALGSFTEALVAESPIPVLTIHPRWRPSSSVGTVIFPTDFSRASAEAFQRAVEFCAQTSKKIVIFHKVKLTEFPPYDFAFSAFLASENAFKSEIGACQAQAKAWVRFAKSRGVAASIEIDTKRVGKTSDAVIKLAAKSGSMIALASQSGPVAAMFLGSTARQIVRNSTQPVWIIHPAQRTRAAVGSWYEQVEKFIFAKPKSTSKRSDQRTLIA